VESLNLVGMEVFESDRKASTLDATNHVVIGGSKSAVLTLK